MLAFTDLSAANPIALLAALASGIVLLVAGFRVLPLLAALVGALVGAGIARAVSASINPEWSLLVAGIVGGGIGALLGAAFLRVALATGAGLAAGVLAAMLALALAERGLVPTGANQPSGESAVADTGREDAAAARAELAAIATEVSQRRSLDEELLARSQSWWESAPSALRTLVLASAGAAGLACFALAILFPKHTAAAFAATLGAAMTTAAGVALVARASGTPIPQRVEAWLLLGLGLAVAGFVIQWRSMQPAPPPA